MKFAAFFVALALCSCAEVSIVDQPQLSRPAMSFDQKGADFSECTLVSQLERGRASSSQSAGGACASCH
ncbi:hypothetical protein OAG59_02550 [Akkermansiaceae bacterium]|nr:hypothetical protein [Akkermansiaceae bacterium]MDC0275159.1 hypothetical protein [Akkermansiaceae bacterium]MDC1405471.1 hypothetical protein [Akkermansiaceae bacterium]